MAVTTVDMPASEPILKEAVQPMGLLDVAFAKAGSQKMVIVKSQFRRILSFKRILNKVHACLNSLFLSCEPLLVKNLMKGNLNTPFTDG